MGADANNFASMFFLHTKVPDLSLLEPSSRTFINYWTHIHGEPAEEHHAQFLICSITEPAAKRHLYLRDLHIGLNLSYFDDIPTPKTLQVDEIFYSTIFLYLRAFSL